jgi:uncharacterized heparinase superfamily protein
MARLSRMVAPARKPAGGAADVDPPRGAWQEPVARPQSLLKPRCFRFLNETHDVAPGDWANRERSALWLYNLHYFDDLNASPFDEARQDQRKQWIRDWTEENAWPSKPAWDAYPSSLRIVNWVKSDLRSGILDGAAKDSLCMQLRSLTDNFEWHLLGNHLFANAKALALGGSYFAGSEAQAWLEKGQRVLARELDEQVLGDGGNFELSPMYHAIFLEDLLDLLNAAKAWPQKWPRALTDRIEAKVGPMLRWLATMTHSDGGIALFNDAAGGAAPTLSSLRDYAGRLSVDVGAFDPKDEESTGCAVAATMLDASGYCRLETAGATLIADVGRIGPDHLPGHAHADTLTFELSLAGQRVFVNQGTSCYGTGAQRQRERETAAHNTVVVNGLSSSQVWGGFRVARRAYPMERQLDCDQAECRLSCAHDGYARTVAAAIHHRTWTMRPGRLRIDDRVSGGGNSAIAYFHCHPELELVCEGDRAQLRLPNGRLATFTVGHGAMRVEQGQYSPEFGMIEPAQVIAVDLVDGRSLVTIEWLED